MKKILLGAVFAALVILSFSPSKTDATSGACSGHGGVSCSAGADYDGSVICNDGWRSSSVSYSSMVMCSSYGSSSSSYNSTPSCPLMSSYDSYSGNCKCYSGYVVGKDYSGREACVSADSLCTDKLGYGGRYNSSSDKCECRSGYLYDGGKCVSETTYCTSKIGVMSHYNSLSDTCECMVGYEFDGSSCEYKKIKTPAYTAPSYTTSCPANSHESASDSTKCTCDAGFEVNASKDACVLKPIPTPPAPVTQKPTPLPVPAKPVVKTTAPEKSVITPKKTPGVDIKKEPVIPAPAPVEAPKQKVSWFKKTIKSIFGR